MRFNKMRRKLLLVFLSMTLLVPAVNVYAEERILSETPEIDGVAEGLTEEQIVKSMTVSQFVRPFGNNVYAVMEDGNIKQAMPELYTDDGKIPAIRHSPLLKESNGSYVRANVKDLFDFSDSSKPNKFFIEFEYDVEIEFEYDAQETDPETGEVKDVVLKDKRVEQKKEYKEVFYTNAYSYFYVSMFASNDPDIAQKFKQSIQTPVSMDMYGNIVLDDGESNEKHRYMVIPNIANPALFSSDKFFLPTRKFISLFQTDLHSLADKTSISKSTFKDYIGDSISDNDIGMYNLNSQFFETCTANILLYGNTKQYLSPDFNIVELATKASGSTAGVNYNSYLTQDYIKFLTAKSTGVDTSVDNLTLFVYGDNHDSIFANRFQTEQYQGNLKYIAQTGIGKTNSSMSVLPTDRLYLGDAIGSHDITIEGAGNFGSNLDIGYYDLNNYSVYDNSIINGKANWVGNFGANEIVVTLKNSESYASEYKPDLFEAVVDFPLNSKDDEGKPSDTLIETPEDVYDQKVNSVVDHMDYLFKNMGTASSAIRTSNMSAEYQNVTGKFNKNFLFHVSEILNDPTLQGMVQDYIRFLVIINSIILLIGVILRAGNTSHNVLLYIKNGLICTGISILPVIILVTFITVYNLTTEKIFNDSFIFWSVLEVDMLNRTDDSESDMQQKVNAYFREYNLSSLESGSSITTYTGNSEEPLTDIRLKEMATEQLHSSGTTVDTIFANKDKYYKSVFYYFYDMYKWHFYNYYSSDIISQTFSSWNDERGLVSTKGNAIKMLTDPVFLYGNSYVQNASGEKDMSDYQNWFGVKPQDIAGLSMLFTQPDGSDFVSFYDDVSYTRWFQTILNKSSLASYGSIDLFDSTTYPTGIIYGCLQDLESSGRASATSLESALDRINNNVAIELMKLSDYDKCKDETVLFMAALITTFEFNQQMNKYLDDSYRLYPTTVNSESVNMDTIYRGIYLEKVEDNETYKGDVISSVEKNGGFLAQGFILFTTFVAQIGGFASYLSIMLVFLFSLYVFVMAYNFARNKFNKAWVGLGFFAGAILITHAIFLVVVNLTCVPSYAVIRQSMFGGYTGLTKNLILLVAVVCKIVIIFLLTKFALSNPTDLGGSIISDKASILFDNASGFIHNFGNSDSQSDEVNLESDSTTFSEDANIDMTDGTAEFKVDTVNIDSSSSTFNSEVSNDFSTKEDMDLYMSGFGDTSNLSGSIGDTDSSLNSGLDNTVAGAFAFGLSDSLATANESSLANIDIIDSGSVNNTSMNTDTAVETVSNSVSDENVSLGSSNDSTTNIESQSSNSMPQSSVGTSDSFLRGTEHTVDNSNDKDSTAETLASSVIVNSGDSLNNVSDDVNVIVNNTKTGDLNVSETKSQDMYHNNTKKIFTQESTKSTIIKPQTSTTGSSDKELQDSLSELINLMGGSNNER